jgi:biopolymer transport protein ExbB
MDLFRDALDYLFHGGWIMAPLVVCSVIMWTLIVERLLFFVKLTGRDLSVNEAIRVLDRGGAGDETSGLRARLVAAFLRERTGRPDLDENVMYHASLRLRPQLHRYLAVIGVLAAVAPLLGLLGTVMGMVQTFDVIAAFGTGNVKALSSGISVALVTTQSGLVVAIPGLFLSGYLYRRASRQEVRLEEITSILMRHVRRGAGAGLTGTAADGRGA